MLPSEVSKLPRLPGWEGFLVFGNISFVIPSQGWVSIPNSFVSLFIFYILSYLLSETTGCLSGCLMSSASFQKLFCGICSVFKWSLDEFVGEKVASSSYFSTILGPHPQADSLSSEPPGKLSGQKTNKQTNKQKNPNEVWKIDFIQLPLYYGYKYVIAILCMFSHWT